MASPRTYDEALRLLSALQGNKAIHNLFIAPPAASKPADLNALAIPEMVAWLARAGIQPGDLAARGLRCVHVAGTKGKGSVSALIASILRRYPSRAGRVGLYTLPHVTSVRERIAVDGAPLPRDVFARYFFEVWDALSKAARVAKDQVPPGEDDAWYDGPETKPFYFRFLTILAFHVFLREGVRSAVVECGIGGEYDSTNVLPAEAVTAAVVTQLGIDHVAMLGDTVEKIAWHKAGVFKNGAVGLTRRLPGPEGERVMQVLRARTEEKQLARLIEVPDEAVEAWDGIPDARLRGPFQKRNMALAAAAAREHLARLGEVFPARFDGDGDEWALDAMPAEFDIGLREATLRGRSEVFVDADGIEWFVDGAHTEDSLVGVGQWFAGQASGDNVVRVLLFNQQDRDPEALLRALLRAASQQMPTCRLFDEAVFTRNEEHPPTEEELHRGSRDMDVQNRCLQTMKDFDADTRLWSQDAVRPAVGLVRDFSRQAAQKGMRCKVLVTGSFHLVQPVLKTIDNIED